MSYKFQTSINSHKLFKIFQKEFGKYVVFTIFDNRFHFLVCFLHIHIFIVNQNYRYWKRQKFDVFSVYFRWKIV